MSYNSQSERYSERGRKPDVQQAIEAAVGYSLRQSSPPYAVGGFDVSKPCSCCPEIFVESDTVKMQNPTGTSNRDTAQTSLSDVPSAPIGEPGDIESFATRPDAVDGQEEGDIIVIPPQEIANSPPQDGSPNPFGYGENDHDSVSGHSTEVISVSEQRTEPPIANIVIFGETGVGKSSVINLIANQDLTRTSNDAVGCTFHYERYSVSLDNISCAIWDTAGLDEGSEGTVPAKEAENSLKELIQKLAQSGGIHLIIYCIRGTRLTRALKRNYDLFYVVACRKKVPVALVVTGLEHKEDGMESWWNENESELRRNGMWFDAHACITTLNVTDEDIQKRRSESQTLLRDLIVKHTGIPGWKTDASLLSLLSRLFHNVFGATSSTGRQENAALAPVRKVLICGPCPRFFSGSTTSNEKGTARIVERRYELCRVDKTALDRITPTICTGVGLLLFYPSVLVDNQILSGDVKVLKEFYDVAGGQSRPVIVVLEGCHDERIARACQIQVGSRYSDIHARFIATPSPDATTKLDEMIDVLCMEQVDIKALVS